MHPLCSTAASLFFAVFFSFLSKPALCTDTLTSTQSLTYNQTLLSSSQNFELGFFTPGNSNWYVGIWYKNIPDRTVVWVANRDDPLANSTGTFKISSQGIVLLDQAGNLVWSSNKTTAWSLRPVMQLLDTGNLVVRDESEEDWYLWQSFDYPTDTLLPDMKLGWDLNTGMERYISSWRSTDDPGTGDFSFKVDYHGFPEVFLWGKQGIVYRSGPWNGMRFSGVPEMKPLDYISFNFITNEDEVYYSFNISSKSLYSRLSVSSNGVLQRFTYVPDTQEWSQLMYAPKDQCDDYRECGPYGVCDSNASPVCQCMSGFQPSNPQAWNLRDGSGGCVRKTQLNCTGNKFLRMKNMKLPETTSSYVDKSLSLKDCELFCLKNCSCTAYATRNISDGSGCVIWVDHLFDMRRYAEEGQDLYVRLAASDVGKSKVSTFDIRQFSTGGADLYIRLANTKLGGENKNKKVIIITTVILISIAIAVCALFSWRWMSYKVRKRNRKNLLHKSKAAYPTSVDGTILENKMNQIKLQEIPLFSLQMLTIATDNFATSNKLGQGGFGPVYQGKFPDEREIAVKRLSTASGQGLQEFMNEVEVISKLQHRNLVRLLGCCVEGEEKMLVYEYMPNKSLDAFLFGPREEERLDWTRRFNIVAGICRGLLYLHRDSRLRIIHRDLKASNILLDHEMNPKISDFGLAKIFAGNQDQAATRRVVGTYGYMAPEYAMEGRFSEKSDVFSFGVLLLEIVSGRRNTSFYGDEDGLSLLDYAWKLWNEDDIAALVDPVIFGPSFRTEVLRCIHVGLLCVQEFARDRPYMSTVISMLNSEIVDLPTPKQPAFTGRRYALDTDASPQSEQKYSVNDMTVSILNGR